MNDSLLLFSTLALVTAARPGWAGACFARRETRRLLRTRRRYPPAASGLTPLALAFWKMTCASTQESCADRLPQ